MSKMDSEQRRRNIMLLEAAEVLAKFGAFAAIAGAKSKDTDTWAQCAEMTITYQDIRRAEVISREIFALPVLSSGAPAAQDLKGKE